MHAGFFCTESTGACVANMSGVYQVHAIGLAEEIAPFVDITTRLVRAGELSVRVRNLSGSELESVVLRLVMNGQDTLGERVALLGKRLECVATFTSDAIRLLPNPDRGPRKIPALIWQTTSIKFMNPQLAGAMRSITERNPAYEHHLVMDSECEDVIRDNFEPHVLEAYRTLVPGAFKADLWRYCSLYVHGGVYVDCKMIAKQPMDAVLAPDTDLLLVFSPMDCIRQMGFTPMYSAVIACVPNHPYIKACIDTTVANVLDRKQPVDQLGLLGITGPNMMFAVLKAMLKVDENVFKHLKILEHSNNGSRKPHMFTVTDPSTSSTVFYKQYPGYYDVVSTDHYQTQPVLYVN